MGCKLSKKSGSKDEEPTAAGAETTKTEDGASSASPGVAVVFGATGVQGGSVVRALSKAEGEWTVKAVTRDPEAEKAKQLAELSGVEVVKADLDNAESVAAAVEGAAVVFAVTNYWEGCDKDKEVQQGKNIVDACKSAGVKHLVYSGLENAEDVLSKPCDHFDSKAAVEAYIKEQEVPSTIVRFAAYYENLLNTLKPRKNDEGTFILDIPMGEEALDMVSASECGECIRQIFKQQDEYLGKVVGLSSQKLKVDEYAAILTKGLTERKVEAAKITTEEFAGLDIPAASQLAAMFEFYQSGKVERDIETTRKLNPEISSFEQWVDSHKDELEKVME